MCSTSLFVIKRRVNWFEQDNYCDNVFVVYVPNILFNIFFSCPLNLCVCVTHIVFHLLESMGEEETNKIVQIEKFGIVVG